MESLHRIGIIHCDLKPDNILIEKYAKNNKDVPDLNKVLGTLYLIDYGISQEY
jgi:serine/threonine protein kinase